MEDNLEKKKKKKMEDDQKKEEKKEDNKKKNKKRQPKKKWKTNHSTKINLIGCDTIVNSPCSDNNTITKNHPYLSLLTDDKH